MSFDRNALIAACEKHGQITRVVVARVRGSAPREIGASMLVWKDGFSGTIGGGTLEYQAIETARAFAPGNSCKTTKHALGPDLGQCCGGAVDLFWDVYNEDAARGLPEDVIIRGLGEMPLSVARIKSDLRKQGIMPVAQLLDGWMIEPVSKPARDVWIWGAGHVGRALVDVFAPLPDVSITWVDTDQSRFPKHTLPNVNIVAAEHPAKLVKYAPSHAEHLIVTYSHQLDLGLCDALLSHEFKSAGLIGSKTKWMRFRSRLSKAGHNPPEIDRITCPIGNPSAGKHPHVIALTVAVDMLSAPSNKSQRMKGIV